MRPNIDLLQKQKKKTFCIIIHPCYCTCVQKRKVSGLMTKEPRAVIRVSSQQTISTKTHDKMFMDECYQIAFGQNALTKRYTHKQVVIRLKEHAETALKINTIENILTARRNNDNASNTQLYSLFKPKVV